MNRVEFDVQLCNLLAKGWSRRDVQINSGLDGDTIGKAIQRLTIAKVIRIKSQGKRGKKDKFYTVNFDKLLTYQQKEKLT